VRREQDLKDRVEKYEFIYDVPLEQKALHNRFFEKEEVLMNTENKSLNGTVVSGRAGTGKTTAQGNIDAMLNKFKYG
jgi:Mg-chelatase subunit ChlI